MTCFSVLSWVLLLFREGARVVWSHIDRILGQPSLVRESSRGKYPWSNITSRKSSALAGAGGTPAVGGTAERTQAMKSGQGFLDVILHPSLHNRIRQLASVTANTKLHAAPYRNMLFYGPPGTGKTMAAKVLAQESVSFFTDIFAWNICG
jgi:ATPase family AAA domain-containing protein 3A/B